MAPGRLNLPNIITIGRIVACPAVAVLILSPSALARLFSFLLFLAAAVSDLWDGYLARKHGLVTNFGKLMDPIADKLLLTATFIPIFILSHGEGPIGPLPWWGPIPAWVVAIIFGRELFVVFSSRWAYNRGVKVFARRSGKWAAFTQNLLIGGALLWYPLQMLALERGWSGGAWGLWDQFHGGWIGITLTLAIVLTLSSMLDYFWGYRTLLGAGR